MSEAPNIRVKRSPLDMLLPYQRKLADDGARFKYALQARQTGKDFTSGAEGIRDCFRHEVKGEKVEWLIVAPSERQSVESLEKWKEWAATFKLDIVQSIDDRTDVRNSESLIKASTMVFRHGSRVMAVPGRPDTVRGFSANIVLTEFAFFEDPDATWRAILPSITNPMRGGLKKCRLVTTPNGVGNKAHELWRKNYQVEGAKWSCHHVDIHEAAAQGLPVDVAELRAALDDPEGWAQEYELNFLDQATVLLPYDLIVPCENPLATAVCAPEFFQAGEAPVYCGVDFGRKRDLTVCWTAEVIGGVLVMTREVLELRQMSTPDQLDALRPRFKRARKVCLDYTGPGIGLGDLAVARQEGFGEYKPEEHKYGKIELCTFTHKLKLELFPALRVAFEQKKLAIPVSRAIREDLHSMSRVALAGGGVTYGAPHQADGHADRCTALALLLRACTITGGPVAFSRVRELRSTAGNLGMGQTTREVVL
jgi:phage FluMu gp28-like protein